MLFLVKAYFQLSCSQPAPWFKKQKKKNRHIKRLHKHSVIDWQRSIIRSSLGRIDLCARLVSFSPALCPAGHVTWSDPAKDTNGIYISWTAPNVTCQTGAQRMRSLFFNDCFACVCVCLFFCKVCSRIDRLSGNMRKEQGAACSKRPGTLRLII